MCRLMKYRRTTNRIQDLCLSAKEVLITKKYCRTGTLRRRMDCWIRGRQNEKSWAANRARLTRITARERAVRCRSWARTTSRMPMHCPIRYKIWTRTGKARAGLQMAFKVHTYQKIAAQELKLKTFWESQQAKIICIFQIRKLKGLIWVLNLKCLRIRLTGKPRWRSSQRADKKLSTLWKGS